MAAEDAALECAWMRMPDVVGLPVGKARLLVENAGLGDATIEFAESYEPEGQVLSQRPACGQSIRAGEEVVLGVSRVSYMKWLPSMYQRAQGNGRNFVRDLLWIVQHLFSSIDEQIDAIHTLFDPHEAPEKFLPWLASWSAMVFDEDWPITKRRRLIKKAVELYRIRGTVKGLKLFLSIFTGHEPEIRENEWPFRGWRIGVASSIAIDSVILPPVNLAHVFVVEMPVAYLDLSPEAVVRIHEIIQMEKPAWTQYYLRFVVEKRPAELRELFIVGVSSGVGMENAESIDAENQLEAAQNRRADRGRTRVELKPGKAPRADNAPVEDQEGPRSSDAGGFGWAARQMQAVSPSQEREAAGAFQTQNDERKEK